MTTTITERQVEGVLKRLVSNTGLPLSLQHSASGYTVYLRDIEKIGNAFKEQLFYANSKSGIYYQLLAASRVIETMRMQMNANECYGHNNPATLLDNR